MKHSLFFATTVSILSACSVPVSEQLPADITTSGISMPLYLAGEPVQEGISTQDIESNALVGITAMRKDPAFAYANGAGGAVAVLDTGIDIDNPAFGAKNSNGISRRIVYQWDYGNDDADATDVNGHGTNVAGIVGSQLATIPGMAPGTNIIALKIFTDSGSSTTDRLETALQWVILNAKKYRIVAVNLSIGDAGNYESNYSMYGTADEFRKLREMDIVTVAAAGNYYKFYSKPGVSFPASDENVLAVGAVYDANVGAPSYSGGAKAFSTAADILAPFSQRWFNSDQIWAPGAVISGPSKTGGVSKYNGTSQAAPHVAGAVALLQQIARKELARQLHFDEMKSVIETTAKTLIDGDEENDNVPHGGQSVKRLDVYAAAKAIRALKPVPTATPKI